MGIDVQKTNDTLIKFWNSSIALSEEDKKEESKNEVRDYEDLAPSEKLFHAVEKLGSCKRVLDYGCGSGWASIVAAKSGCADVTAVDMGQNIIDALDFYADLYEVKSSIKSVKISSDWLSIVPSDSFDGFVCSNVLDVVPVEVSKEILKETSRIVTKDAKIVIGLNFYMSKEAAESRGMNLVDGKYLFVNDVLRLVSISDEEWIEMFKPYFKIKKLDHFAWPGEQKETRRLFELRII